MFESDGKDLNSVMLNRFKSLCWNVCSAVGCHLGAGWTGLKLLSFRCVSTSSMDVRSPLGCVQRMSSGAATWGLLRSCVKGSCGRGM